MSNDIKIGSTVQLLYWKDKKVHDFVITDIFFERYFTGGYKTVIKAKYYSKTCDCWFIETYFVAGFFVAMNKAKEIIADNKEEANE